MSVAASHRGRRPDRAPGSGLARAPEGLSALSGVLIALLIFGFIQVVLIRAGMPPVFDQELWDTDSYMWLNRARHLWESGAWFDPVYPRIDPPAGFVQHWTRPVDVLLLAGALPLSWLLGFEDALFWWSAALSPLLLAAALPLLVWAVRPLIPARWTWLAGLAFVFQPGVISHFMAGRPDHHALLLLLYVAQLGFMLRLLEPGARQRTAVFAGLAAALALWVSVQILPVVTVAILTLGLFWLAGERPLARLLRTYAIALLFGVAGALLAERGLARLGQSAFDTLSAAHFILFALNLAVWSAAECLQRRTGLLAGVTGRLAWAMTAAAASVAVLTLAEPGFFKGPMADIDPLYRDLILGRVKELAPTLPLTGDGGWSWRRHVAMPLIWLGIALPAVPYLVYLIATRRAVERRRWVFIGVLALAFLPPAVAQIRWLSFADVALVVPYARLGAVALARLSRPSVPAFASGLLRPLAIAAFCLWFFVPLGASKMAGSATPPGADRDPAAAAITRDMICPLRPLARVLADPEGLGAEPQRILAFLDFGPEILYRTPHAVYAIPNHRYQPGLVATHRIMTATDFSHAERLMRDRGVDLVLVCPTVAGIPYVEQFVYETGDSAATLYRALAAGRPPPFLRPVPLPAPLSETFKLFALREASGA